MENKIYLILTVWKLTSLKSLYLLLWPLLNVHYSFYPSVFQYNSLHRALCIAYTKSSKFLSNILCPPPPPHPQLHSITNLSFPLSHPSHPSLPPHYYPFTPYLTYPLPLIFLLSLSSITSPVPTRSRVIPFIWAPKPPSPQTPPPPNLNSPLQPLLLPSSVTPLPLQPVLLFLLIRPSIDFQKMIYHNQQHR